MEKFREACRLSTLCPSIRIVLVSAQPFWLQACRQVLKYQPHPIEVAPILADGEWWHRLEEALALNPSVVAVSLEAPIVTLDLVLALRAGGYGGPILVLCSLQAPPPLEALAECSVQSMVRAAASFEEIGQACYALAHGQSATLAAQYEVATRRMAHQHILNPREREVLQLVACDLNDSEIALQLGLSVRTVSNHLRHVYARLGVKGRAGAVAVGISHNIILPPIEASPDYACIADSSTPALLFTP